MITEYFDKTKMRLDVGNILEKNVPKFLHKNKRCIYNNRMSKRQVNTKKINISMHS